MRTRRKWSNQTSHISFPQGKEETSGEEEIKKMWTPLAGSQSSQLISSSRTGSLGMFLPAGQRTFLSNQSFHFFYLFPLFARKQERRSGKRTSLTGQWPLSTGGSSLQLVVSGSVMTLVFWQLPTTSYFPTSPFSLLKGKGRREVNRLLQDSCEPFACQRMCSPVESWQPVILATSRQLMTLAIFWW